MLLLLLLLLLLLGSIDMLVNDKVHTWLELPLYNGPNFECHCLQIITNNGVALCHRAAIGDSGGWATAFSASASDMDTGQPSASTTLLL